MQTISRLYRVAAAVLLALGISGYANLALGANPIAQQTQEAALFGTVKAGPKLITQAAVMRGRITPDDAPGFPVTISESGSYVLASDLFALEGDSCQAVPGFGSPSCAVDITADDVTLDFNGFQISGAQPDVGYLQIGILAIDQRNAAIRNGTLTGFVNFGMRIGSDSRIESMRLSKTGFAGDGSPIIIGEGCTVIRNTIADSEPEGAAIDVFGGGCLIADNTIINSVGQGISVTNAVSGSETELSGCTIARNTIDDSFGSGIYVNGACTITENIVTRASTNGIFAGPGSVLRGNAVDKSGRDGIVVGGNCIIVGNASSNNGGGGPLADGIQFGVGCTVKDNTTNHNSGDGLDGYIVDATTAGSTVIENTANFNDGDGIRVAPGSTIKGNTVSRNGDDGIETIGVSLVLGNSVTANTNFGLNLGLRAGYGHNVLADNNGPSGNNNLQVFSGVEIDTNVCGSDTTCP